MSLPTKTVHMLGYDNTDVIADFEGGNGRKGIIQYAYNSYCDICLTEKPVVVSIDGSEDEYNPGHICTDCCHQA